MPLPAADRIVLSQPFGGLGDNLLYSTLPERFAALGKTVWIARKNVVRSQSAFDLVWGSNPYVSGVVDEEPNAGECCYGVYATQGLGPKVKNIIARIEDAHGLEPTGSIPKIYYKPTLIEELSDKIIIDINSNTVNFTGADVTMFVSQMFAWYRYPREKALQIRLEATANVKNVVSINNIGEIELKDIFHYCDVIYSCASFVTVHSGAHCMAVALRGFERETPHIDCLVSKDYFNSRMAIFPGVEYFVC